MGHTGTSQRQDPTPVLKRLLGRRGTQEEVRQAVYSAAPGRPVLLCHGTGTGKTRAAFSLAVFNLLRGVSTIVLLPEIVLVNILKNLVLPEASGVIFWHSGLTPKQRRSAMSRLLSTRNCIVVGTRSALFLPVNNLDAVIVDEVGDSSLSQEAGPAYNVYDLVRALPARQVFMTSTPTPYVFHDCVASGVRLLGADRGRHNQAVRIVQSEGSEIPWGTIVSMKRVLLKGKSVIVFLNHRGFSNRIVDGRTGRYLVCPACKRYLFYHRAADKLDCHKCDKQWGYSLLGVPKADIAFPGVGVEQLCDRLQYCLGRHVVEWVSSDLTNSKRNEKIANLRAGRPIVLVTTQTMIRSHHIAGLQESIYVESVYSRNSTPVRKLSELIQLMGRTESGKATVITWRPRCAWIREPDRLFTDLCDRLESARGDAWVVDFEHASAGLRDTLREWGVGFSVTGYSSKGTHFTLRADREQMMRIIRTFPEVKKKVFYREF